MTEETGNGGTVRSLASICIRAIFRSKAEISKNRYGVSYHGTTSVLCQTVEFEKFVRALSVPKNLKDLMMSYPENNCTGCRSKVWAKKLFTKEFRVLQKSSGSLFPESTKEFHTKSRLVQWHTSLNPSGCVLTNSVFHPNNSVCSVLAGGCDCCTCNHGTSCHCEHCGQSEGEDEEDLEEEEDWFVEESDGWESSDHSEGACTNSKCDAYSPCKDCTKNTDDEDEEEQYDRTDGLEEEQDDSTDGEEEEQQDGSTDGDEQEEKDGNDDE